MGDSLHLSEESGGLCGPYGPAPPWHSVALEWDGDGGKVGVGGVHFLGAHSFSVCVEEVGREDRCEAEA